MKIAAIILAAGGSARFGTPKPLLKLNDKSLVCRTVDAAVGANCSPVIVVTGAAAPLIDRQLAGAVSIQIENENWQRGIGSSIRYGVRYLAERFEDIGAVVLLVCDQPFVSASTIQNLVSLRIKMGKPIVASTYDNTVGVPALFDRALLAELLEIDDPTGAKAVIMRDQERLTRFPFPQGNIDIDTVEQWNELQSVSVPRKISAA